MWVEEIGDYKVATIFNGVTCWHPYTTSVRYLMDSPVEGRQSQYSRNLIEAKENHWQAVGWAKERSLKLKNSTVLPPNKLRTFLYILARDVTTFGEIESIIENHVEKTATSDQTIYENEPLAKYADDLAKRLAGG